jgi:hypothetical protein
MFVVILGVGIDNGVLVPLLEGIVALEVYSMLN